MTPFAEADGVFLKVIFSNFERTCPLQRCLKSDYSPFRMVHSRIRSADSRIGLCDSRFHRPYSRIQHLYSKIHENQTIKQVTKVVTLLRFSLEKRCLTLTLRKGVK